MLWLGSLTRHKWECSKFIHPKTYFLRIPSRINWTIGCWTNRWKHTSSFNSTHEYLVELALWRAYGIPISAFSLVFKWIHSFCWGKCVYLNIKKKEVNGSLPKWASILTVFTLIVARVLVFCWKMKNKANQYRSSENRFNHLKWASKSYKWLDLEILTIVNNMFF